MRRVVSLLAVAVTLAGAALITAPYAHGVSFVIRAADLQGTPRRLADLDTGAVQQREIAIPTPRGSLRARVYAPTSPNRRVALLTSGLHVSGIDEPRLTRLAHELAASGMVVVTPDIPELSRFEISPAITDTIERAAVWLATESGLDGDQRIGMMGISFSGGLSLVAAGRPSLKDHVNYVFSFGGHADLPRVLRYLCTGIEPMPSGRVQLATPKRAEANGAREGGPDQSGVRLQPDQQFVLAPHDYGVAVLLLAMADRLVPATQVAPLRDAIRRYLTASALDSNVDKDKAAREFDALKLVAKTMREPSATLLRYINERDVVHLGARLLPIVGSYGSDPALSESRSPKPAAPVFLLHGAEDNVIPSVETVLLTNYLRGKTEVHAVLSGLITHAEVDKSAAAIEVWRLVGFWKDLMSE